MASLATIFRGIFEQAQAAEGIAQATGSRVAVDDFRVRPLPNEEIYFYVKRVDNSRVVKQADARARRTCWGVIGGFAASAVVLTAVLLPAGYNIHSGYRLQKLREERQEMERQRAGLVVREARLTSAEWLNQHANGAFVPPTPDSMVYLEDSGAPALAAKR